MFFIKFQRLILTKNFNLISNNIRTFNKFCSPVLKSSINNSSTSFVLTPIRLVSKEKFIVWNRLYVSSRNIQSAASLYGAKGIQENVSTLQMKRRTLRKKRPINENEDQNLPGYWNVKSMATAEEYDLEGLVDGLTKQDLYIPERICTSSKSMPDVVHAVAKYEVDVEPREAYFFREGTVVFWNMSELESGNLLQFLKAYEEGRYPEILIQSESELMLYAYSETAKQSHLKDGNIMLASDAKEFDKYTFSNGMALSVKLGVWEASLDRYVDSIAFVTDDLKSGRAIKMSREEVLRKQGELFALRHMINLSSDLLDTPDFYWEREELENLFQQTCGYFSISKRTRVMNEKLNHCVELVELLSSHLSDRHHVRLEWMIIILIMVEVLFEVMHYIDRYLGNREEKFREVLS